jgi:hypothetical protein
MFDRFFIKSQFFSVLTSVHASSISNSGVVSFGLSGPHLIAEKIYGNFN